MNQIGRGLGGARRSLRVLVTFVAVLALVPLAGINQASAQAGTATIQVQSFGPDGATPLPFARFTVTASDGATYGPLESTLDGAVTFTVDTGDDVTYTVEESVPPSCGVAPDPQEVGPLTDGESAAVSFTTQFDDDCDRGSISAYKYTCPAGFDPASSYDAFVAECAEEVDGNPFQLDENGAEILTVQTGAYGIAGRAPIVDLTPGDYQLIDLAEGDEAANVAFCLTFPGNQADGGGPTDIAPAELNDGAVDVSTDDNRIACDFFVIPGDEGDDDGQDGEDGDDGQVEEDDSDDQPQEQEQQPEDGEDGDDGQGQDNEDDLQVAQTGTGYIELHKAVCPAGYDDGNYFEDCHGDGVEGVEFTIDGPNGYNDSADTVIIDDPGPGIIAFADLEAGAYVINEDVPGDVTDTYVYCSMANSEEVVPFEETDEGGIALDLADGQAVVCDWYNIPVQQFENARLEVVKHTCPTDYDAEGAFYAELLDNCSDVTADVTFTLTRQEDPSFERVKVTSGSGRVVYGDLVPGTYVLTEDVPAGIEEIVLVCTVDGGSPYAKEVANGATSFGIDGTGQQVSCDWFNIPPFDAPEPPPDTGTGYIELHKAVCPPGYDDGNFFEDCHEDGVEGVEFTIDGPDGYNNSATTVFLDDPDEDPGPGVAAFADLEAGAYVINEDVPGDVTDTFVYCSMATSEEVVPFDYTDQGGIALDLAEDQAVVCDWYNIPVQQFDPGALEVTKYTCPTGYDGNASYGDFLDDCDNPTEGVTFRITEQGAVEPHSDTTGGNGVASFDNLNPSLYQVSEDVPDEFASPVAFCSVNGGEAFALDLGDGTGYLEFDGSGQAITCDWFNIPADLRADAQITIQKRLCPEGYNGGNYVDACDDAVQNVTFNADGPQGYDENATTGQEGIAFFENLTAGSYVVTELPPDNINVAVYVVGCSDASGSVPFTYDDSTGLRIILTVKAGQDVTCNWYNIPPSQGPSGSITVHKFLCQGKDDNKYNWEQECVNYGSGAEFELQTATGDPIVRRTTSVDGLATFANLADGAYGLDETNGNWCHAEADNVDAQGNVLVQNGGDTDVFVYNCGKKGVDQLPNTGVGPTPGTSGHAALWSIAGGLGGLLLLFIARRHRPHPALKRTA
ncbi:MAG: MSCRAMM family protein [Thermomicrobiales bacterium]